MKTTTAGKMFKVVANGMESIPFPMRTAEKLARELREGRSGRHTGLLKVAARVVPA